MLIRFRVRNFLSFKDEVEFSMIPGRTRLRRNHVISGGDSRNDIDMLRAGVIYGANASGKSNFVKAISFAQHLVVEGVKPKQAIPVKPFKLDRACAGLPSMFAFEFRQNQRNYLYSFEIDSRKVHTERLYEIKKTTEAMIFERRTSDDDTISVEFGALALSDKKERDFLQFVAHGTRPNQLFLRESIERNVKFFEDIYRWFTRVLTIVFPETRYFIKLQERAGETQAMVDYLDRFGTGVCGSELLPVSPQAEFPPSFLDELTRNLEVGQSAHVLKSETVQRYQVSKNEQQELEAVKLMFKHKMSDCDETVSMDTSEESDGTVRLLDLIPILTLPEQSARVFVVDELDRSLHPTLCYELIERFLERPGNSQLVVTTHEINILSLDLLRRDEIWFIEKNGQGTSTMYSLEEFAPRYDKDIRKGYLLGRFGAIPIIGKKSLYKERSSHA